MIDHSILNKSTIFNGNMRYFFDKKLHHVTVQK